MLTWATTTISVLGGTGIDEFGDPVDGTTVAASGVPASIIEQSKTVNDPASGTPRVVRSIIGRVPAGTPVTGDNRVRDERTGVTYVVDSTTQPSNPLWVQEIRLDLRETTTT